MRDEILNDIIAKTEREIITSDIMIDFYRSVAKKEKNKDKASQYEVKADQLAATKEFNEKFIEYAKKA